MIYRFDINIKDATTLGIVGAGGIGDFAIRYGYQMGYRDMIWLTVLIILAIISIFQFFGNMIIRRTTH